MKTSRFFLTLTAIALVAAGCGGNSSSATTTTAPPPSSDASSGPGAAETAAGTQIAIEDFAFAPRRETIGVGDTVTWTNGDDILHTVTSGRGQEQGVPGVTKDKEAKPTGLFDQEVEFNDTFEFSFDEAGTYAYFCAIHPGMVGTIVVE